MQWPEKGGTSSPSRGWDNLPVSFDIDMALGGSPDQVPQVSGHYTGHLDQHGTLRQQNLRTSSRPQAAAQTASFLTDLRFHQSLGISMDHRHQHGLC